jgi:hypothetical protein
MRLRIAPNPAPTDPRFAKETEGRNSSYTPIDESNCRGQSEALRAGNTFP